MKLELNPNKMTAEELTDAINELVVQRERILEEKRQRVELQLNLLMIDVLKSVDDYANDYDCYLKVEAKSGRTYKVPLNIEALNSWHIEPRAKEGT